MTTDVKQAGYQRKVLGVPLQKGIEKTPEGFCKVRGFFTSDNKDEIGDIINRSATERALPRYRQWGNIRRMHAPDPVGRVLRIGTEDGLQWNEVEILVIDPKAAFEVENGLLKALSVGILFTYDDIDFLEDGGLIINDYLLAEISLVDHPANYDAMLNLHLDSQDRVIARQLGIHDFLQTRSLKENPPMKEEKSAQAAEVASTPAETPAEPVAETPSEPVAEEPRAATPEEVKTVEEAAQTIAEAHNEQPVEPVAEETPAPVAEEAAPAAEPVALEASVPAPAAVDPIQKQLDALLQITTNLVEVTRNLTAPKAEVPPQQVEAQADASVPQASETVAEPEDKEAGVAANRKGGVVAEPKPVVEETKDVEAPETPVEEKPKSLRDAVRKFAETRPH